MHFDSLYQNKQVDPLSIFDDVDFLHTLPLIAWIDKLIM